MYNKRFFSESSFWNTPIPDNPVVSAEDKHFKELLNEYKGFHLNVDTWTIPIYYADQNTPKYKLEHKIMECPISQGHLLATQPWIDGDHPVGIHKSAQGYIPIPDEAQPDGENDAHMAIVDLSEGRVYDMWQLRKNDDGSWSTNAAIAYDLDGEGVYKLKDFANVHNNESIHYYGPCRASGVPSIAGLIMQNEIEQGKIEHKLAFACPKVGLQKFCYPPAIWTDGWLPDGIPEGISMQLSPDLDLTKFDLSPAALIVATALQQYGAALVDFSGDITLYAEGLFSKDEERSWDGILNEFSMIGIGFDNFRFIQPEEVINKGSHPVFHSGMSRLFYDYCIENKVAAPVPILEL